jgi:hypothetical protein
VELVVVELEGDRDISSFVELMVMIVLVVDVDKRPDAVSITGVNMIVGLEVVLETEVEVIVI